MRIVIDARESGTSTGRYVDKLIEYLHKLKPDHEILLLSKSHRLEFFNKIAPDFSAVECNIKEFSFAEQLALKRQIKSLGPDLIHFTMPQQPVLYKGRCVTTIHDLITVRFDNPSKNSFVFKIKQQIYRAVIKRVARKSARLIAISNYTKKDLTNFSGVSPTKIDVIYEAADKITERPQPLKELAGKKFVMYVGRPNPHKNLKRLIEAMETVRKHDPKLLLVLAGKTDDNYRTLQKFASEINLTSQVYFTDFVSDAELRWLYEHAQAYVFPSLNEGFGLPGLEAMCYSLPVISSDATCLPEIYKDAALYFSPTDVSDMAAKIIEVTSDPALRADLAERGNKLVKTYSWHTMAQQTLALYEEALTPRQK